MAIMRNSRTYAVIAACILLGIGIVSCKKGKTEPTVAPPVRVTVMQTGSGGVNAIREYSGTVSSENTTTVSFPIAGTIMSLNAKEGDKVNKGQILGRLKSGEYENAYNIAQAQLAEAQDGYNRLKKLHDANALPEVKWVEMEQKLKQAENMAEMAKRTLDDAILTSPVSGSVTRKFVEAGQNVMPVEPVYEIMSTRDLTIDISVGENEIGGFEKGEEAEITFDGAGLGKMEGKVTQKSIVADPLTRSYTVKVSIPSTGGKILPGMLGNVRFKGKEIADSAGSNVILPSGSVLLNHDNRWFVWVVEDSTAQRRFVDVDELVSNGILVKSGLKAGELVIIEGMQKVGSGSRVIPLYK